MIRMFKKYKCGSNTSCIAKKGEIETKMRKTHKTIVKQRENKIKTRQNATIQLYEKTLLYFIEKEKEAVYNQNYKNKYVSK